MILKGMPWLRKQLKKIEETNSSFKEEISKIKNIDSYICNEFNLWTPLKLTFLNFTLDVCAIVANKKYSNKNYIDLFSGSGINKMKNKHGDILIGSPFISLLNQSDKFTNFFFCEKDPYFFNALKNRINFLGFQNVCFSQKDCNNCLDEILKKINQRDSYNFFFIDPFNLEFSWKSMKKILNIRSDILITFMSQACWRAFCTNEKTGHGYKALTNFFGDDSWKNASGEKELLEIYKKNILKERPDSIISSVYIKPIKGMAYNLIFITHKTGGNNPWMKPIVETGREIEKHSEKAVEMALEIIKKRQTTLF